MRRRTLLPLIGSTVLSATPFAAADQSPPQPAGKATLASAPIELHGDWAGSLPQAALLVVSRMREVCLADVRLLSDRQPDRLRVDNHTSGSPAVWLHFDGTSIAWIIVDIGTSDWSKLAYQFGHELGHVLCNSWGPDAKPQNSCQWLEEALVESFSIHSLGKLADSWAANPPISGDAAFAGAIRQYRDNLVAQYRTIATEQGATRSLAAWFQASRGALATDGGVAGPARGAIFSVLGELDADPAGTEAFGALNRWPGRSGCRSRSISGCGSEAARRWRRRSGCRYGCGTCCCGEAGDSRLWVPKLLWCPSVLPFGRLIWGIRGDIVEPGEQLRKSLNS
jgi:hypothetical protein